MTNSQNGRTVAATKWQLQRFCTSSEVMWPVYIIKPVFSSSGMAGYLAESTQKWNRSCKPVSGCWPEHVSAWMSLCLKRTAPDFQLFRGVPLNELNLSDVSKCWVSKRELVSSWKWRCMCTNVKSALFTYITELWRCSFPIFLLSLLLKLGWS